MTSKPPPLKPGDTIGIAASSSPFDRTEFEKGVKTLERAGFKVSFRQDIFDRHRYLAGSDKRRLDELVGLLENPDIQAIFFARGGYGMLRLLPLLTQKKISPTPKIILGYSDLTSLFIYLYQQWEWVTFYGPVVARDLGSSLNPETQKHLLEALSQTAPLGPYCYSEMLSVRKGSCEGVMVGGCLSLVVASLGTPFEIETDNRILFLEDTNEKPYSVDRMLTQLVLAKKLEKVKGILFGSFSNGGELDHFREVAEDVLKDFKGPILFNFPAGHGPVKVTLPLGIQVRLDADKKTLTYLEEACRPSIQS